MKPYYEQSGVTIYHGDCRQIVDDLGVSWGEKFDVMLTDPPYGHGEKWSGGTWASDPMYDDAKVWDAATIPDADLISLLKLSRFQIVWGGNYYRMPPSRCWLAWVKSSQMDTLADFELAWTNFDRPAKLLREDRNADGKRWHPTQKPQSLMRWCLRQVPAPIRTVFDPFMGSGTTLRAAKDNGMRAIGIELDERYCEIAAKRLQQEVLPLEMDDPIGQDLTGTLL